MRDVLITTDPVLLSFAKSVLSDAGIEATIDDQYTSSIEGSVGILPRRLRVTVDRWEAARAALVNAELGDAVVADDGAVAS